jgi:hypothetical protein
MPWICQHSGSDHPALQNRTNRVTNLFIRPCSSSTTRPTAPSAASTACVWPVMGTRRSTLDELAERTLAAKRVLVF